MVIHITNLSVFEARITYANQPEIIYFNLINKHSLNAIHPNLLILLIDTEIVLPICPPNVDTRLTERFYDVPGWERETMLG